ncbi:expressed unknown protein [Seminavis robusta]|uniref:RING-type domain-containing protein n=1 Tax=Seminavis robusta TaxID=568900 RepID=A0A9N8HFQ0_9STRA|nr:expressed unknown protein [Seminavis robusta]|eukprot:Sro445_g144590.1 n/a (510) ;mRNA; r:53439-54968
MSLLAPEDEMTLSYPGWALDKEEAEKLFIEYSSTSASDCFNRKIIAMKNKERLYQGDRSHPDIVALDSTVFTYNGWEQDKEECEQRHTGDCILLHMGTYGFQDLFAKMKRKQKLHCDRRSVEGLRELDAGHFTYPGWEADRQQAEKFYIDYSTDSRDDCFYHKLRAMQHKQKLHEGDRSHPEIMALDATLFTYKGWEADKEEAIRRHTGDCMTFNLGHSGFESHFQKMKKKQKMHVDRASLPGLQELDNTVFTFPGWEVDRAVCEKYFVEYSTSSTADCFHRKFVAMKNKQRLYMGDRSHPDIRALDGTAFSYDGWEDDKKEAEKRLTGDCILLHMGSLGFNDIFSKMKKKQALHVDRSSIQCLRDLDNLVPSASSASLAQQGQEGQEEQQPAEEVQQTEATSPVVASSVPAVTTASISQPVEQAEATKEATAATTATNSAIPEPQECSIAKATRENKCVVCLENQPSHAYIPCGHLCVCGDCVARYDSTGDCCPLCRERSYCVTKIYC